MFYFFISLTKKIQLNINVNVVLTLEEKLNTMKLNLGTGKI